VTAPAAPPPRLLAADDPAAASLRATAVPAGQRPVGEHLCVEIGAPDPATALAELAWAIARGAEVVLVPDLEAARDYLTVHAALHGWVEVDPGLALAPELRREPPSS
jgi:citrate lyase beta subunit